MAAFNQSRLWDSILSLATQVPVIDRPNESVINSDPFIVQHDPLPDDLAQFISQFDINDSDTLFTSVSRIENDSLISEELSNAILVLVYSLLVFVSLFGNTFVCRVMMTLSGNNKTTTNLLILNLAFSGTVHLYFQFSC